MVNLFEKRSFCCPSWTHSWTNLTTLLWLTLLILPINEPKSSRYTQQKVCDVYEFPPEIYSCKSSACEAKVMVFLGPPCNLFPVHIIPHFWSGRKGSRWLVITKDRASSAALLQKLLSSASIFHLPPLPWVWCPFIHTQLYFSYQYLL